MPKTAFLEAALLDHVFKNTAIFTTLATVYVSLHTADPTDSGSNEVTGGSYARKSVAAAGWTRTASQIANNAAITFVEATAGWGTITHFGIWSAVSGGNFLYYAPLNTQRLINSGDIAEFAASQLTVTET